MGGIAAMMLPIDSGAVDFTHPWSDQTASSGKYQWLTRLLEWFRTSPNTTHALAWLCIIRSLGLFVIRIRGGWLRQSQASKSDNVHW